MGKKLKSGPNRSKHPQNKQSSVFQSKTGKGSSQGTTQRLYGVLHFKINQRTGVSMVVYPVYPLPVAPVSHTGSSSTPSCSTSNRLIAMA